MRHAITIVITLILLLVDSCASPLNEHSDSKFRAAMNVVYRHEGGLSNNKFDPGGITSYGLSLRYLRAEHIDPNNDGKIDANDVIHLTHSEADDIYYKEWWKRYNFESINDVVVSTHIYDFAINAGISQSTKLAQRAINKIRPDKIKVNGIFDKKTIEEINSCPKLIFLNTFHREQEDFYFDIVKRNPHLHVFLGGWLKRIQD